MLTNSHQILKKYFGYDQFRSGQTEIINSIISKNDCLAILATGGGKSICFQIPGLMFPGITLVISPLISLMKDQVETLMKKGIRATYINSSISVKEIINRYQQISQKKFKFVYLAPERLVSPQFIKLSHKVNISLVAVDEAHCVSMWGHDFRPSYQQIIQFINQLQQRPVVAAFTATATHQTQQDIVTSLQLNQAKIFLNSFKRDNLSINIIKTKNKTNKLIQLIKLIKKHSGQTGIIYASTRKTTENVTKLLTKQLGRSNFKVAAYHGGMSNQQRNNIQDKFLSNQISIIVSTNAFGMGVDKSNIRFVIHYQIPGSIENYYQEIGRAGRDRKPADSYLLFNEDDIAIQLGFIKKNPARANFNLKKLKSIINFIHLNDCHHHKILTYFGELNSNHKCLNCNHCLNQIKSNQQEQFFKTNIIKLRNKLAFDNNIAPHQILTQKIIDYLALLKPTTKQEFLSIPGIGKGWLEEWYNIMSKNIKNYQ